MNKAIMIMLAALAAFAGFSEDVRTDSAGNVYARFGSLGRNSFVATNVVEGLPLSGGDMTGPLNMGFNPITFNGSTNASEWALWDMLRAWPTGADGPVLLPFVVTNAIAREVDGILDGRKPFTAFNVNLPLGPGMADPLQNFWVNGTNLHDWVQILAPVPDLSAGLGAFSATGSVLRASRWGTEDRWTDATGTVWRATFDPWNDRWTIEPAEEARNMYIRWDGDTWVFGYEGVEIDTGHGADEYSMTINMGAVYTAVRHPGGAPEAVDRVAFATDLASAQPGNYETVSNNAMHAVQQIGDEIDVGTFGVISWGPNSHDYKLAVGDNSLATGWLFRWQWGTICLPYMEGDNVVALLGDIPSWARASSKPSYTAEEVGAIAKTGGVYSVTRGLHISPRLSVGTFTASVPPIDMSGGGTGNAFVFGDNIQTRAPDTVTLGVGTLNTNNYSFVWSGDANRYYMPTVPSMSNPYSTKYNGGFHVNPSVRSGMSGPLENFWIGEKNLDTWIGEKSVTPQTVTNVVRRIVSVTSDYVWDAQAECLYRRSMENQFLYWTPVTNVNALLPENAHILEYLEEHKND